MPLFSLCLLSINKEFNRKNNLLKTAEIQINEKTFVF